MVVGAEGHLIDGRFELLARLGGGGMGLVWRARDVLLQREVALKEVRPPDPELLRLRPDAADLLRARVLREAVALAQLSHPNVVTIHHIVSSSEVAHPWLVMELIPGGSLHDRLDRGPCTPTETAHLGRGVLAALRAAHEAGILHRDVKPGNVLLRANGTPVLTDFGIAAVREATSLTNTGELIGSPDYMAPERLRGHDDDPSSDLWSLAMMLYVAVEGRHPLRRSSTLATLAAILEEDVPPPRQAGALGPALRSVLTQDVTARPDAQALDLLLAEATGERVRTHPTGLTPPTAATHEHAPTTEEPPSAEPQDAVPDTENSRTDRSDAPRGTDTGGPGEPRADTDEADRSPAPTDPGDNGEATEPIPPHLRPAVRRTLLIVRTTLSLLTVVLIAWTVVPWFLDDDQAADPAGGSTASSSPSPSPTAEATRKENLFTPEGARRVLSESTRVMGRTEAIRFSLSETTATSEVVSADGEVHDTFDYADGRGKKRGDGGLMNSQQSFDPATVDWDALPRLIRVAKTELELRQPKIEHINLEVNDDGPYIEVLASGEYGSASLRATFDGEITERELAH